RPRPASRLDRDGQPPLRRDRGHHDRRLRRRDGHGPDQDRGAVAFGAGREVQPAAPDRAGARRRGHLPGSSGPRPDEPVSRLIDRGALTAAYVGIGMAVTTGLSFLLIIPIEPIYWALSIPTGLLIGWYAGVRSGRARGEWRRIITNAVFAGLATGLTLAIFLLAVKALFFFADDGYRDPGLGGRITCAGGADCVY